jgi:peroxiredoxin
MNRRVFATTIAAAAISLIAMPALHAEPKVGAPAPAFTAVDSNGKTVNLGDFKGKTVVLEWTNDGCPYVQKHYKAGAMQKLQKDAAKDGVVWLTLVSSAPGKQGHLSETEAK